jgi:RNA polymerase sigma-70 factor (ECF subfamily)
MTAYEHLRPAPASAASEGNATGRAVTRIEDVPDETLVAALARGDQRALAQLVQRHGGWAARFAERMTGSPQVAEEVVQNAFLRLWNSAERWEGRSRFTTWFYRVLHNLAVDELRRRRSGHEELDEALEDPAATPPQLLEQERRAARVRAALERLPERQRAALVLRHYEGCSQGEAAQILGISEGALESLLSRGRATLREQLRGELH